VQALFRSYHRLSCSSSLSSLGGLGSLGGLSKVIRLSSSSGSADGRADGRTDGRASQIFVVLLRQLKC
jgi:hypothetical protein